MNTYTIYFIDGLRRIAIGPTIEQAMKQAGIGLEAQRRLCFYLEGACTDYVWNPTHCLWSIKNSTSKPRRRPKPRRRDDRTQDLFGKAS